MINLLAQIRQHLPVGILSNCTDALNDDLKYHSIVFDHVFPSAELGVDKPSPHAYLRAAERMDIAPDALAYFDDEPTFVQAARTLGMHARLFTGPAEFSERLLSFGLVVDPQAEVAAESQKAAPE
ncbi:hypothetical protein GCM10010344_70620 [Streptomyces bluensis]|nr:hypothetical protein GCM10010344_70620 [Streptomyces bluensis]